MFYKCKFCGKDFDVGFRVVIETNQILIFIYACNNCKEGGRINEKVNLDTLAVDG